MGRGDKYDEHAIIILLRTPALTNLKYDEDAIIIILRTLALTNLKIVTIVTSTRGGGCRRRQQPLAAAGGVKLQYTGTSRLWRKALFVILGVIATAISVAAIMTAIVDMLLRTSSKLSEPPRSASSS